MSTTARSAGKRKERQSTAFPAACFFGVLVAFLTGALLLPAAAMLLMRGADPARLSGTLSYLIALLLPLLGGYMGARRRGQSGALVGISVATVTVFLFLAVALTISGGAITGAAIPLYGGMLLSGTIGGRLATHRAKHPRRRRH